MIRLMEVTFGLVKHAPSTLKEMKFFVDTKSKVIARDRAINQLKYDLTIIAMRLNCAAPYLFEFYTTNAAVFSSVSVIEA